ncbi:hypothetical protein EJ08DRAFT_665284 [Tothia fuscella]|uniref:Uncharacterized protein n=1 Tax=Tothia fuscella TaxID=1048955 RepID=A0A9P4TTU6_9PEZI|nr:hypothetical protein EJ08DRAFT_665284 [Tothia fuscella]
MATTTTSEPIYLVTNPTPASSSSSPTQTPTQNDPQVNLKFVIPIVVGTFLAGAAITLLLLLFYCRRRRMRKLYSRRERNSLTILSSKNNSPYLQGPRSKSIHSPMMSPTRSHFGKETRSNSIGNILELEVGNGPKTPVEMVGDTTWEKGPLSPEVKRMSRFMNSDGSVRVSRHILELSTVPPTRHGPSGRLLSRYASNASLTELAALPPTRDGEDQGKGLGLSIVGTLSASLPTQAGEDSCRQISRLSRVEEVSVYSSTRDIQGLNRSMSRLSELSLLPPRPGPPSGESSFVDSRNSSIVVGMPNAPPAHELKAPNDIEELMELSALPPTHLGRDGRAAPRGSVATLELMGLPPDGGADERQSRRASEVKIGGDGGGSKLN